MCGRYAIPEPGDIPVHFKGTRVGYDLKPRFNAAPSEDLPVIVNDGETHVEMMRWGLVPFWASLRLLHCKYFRLHYLFRKLL